MGGTVSYIHWRGVPQGPGLGLRPRPGPLRYTPTVNVGKLFSHAPRMAQITAAARSWLQWSIVVLSGELEPCKRRGEIPFWSLEFFRYFPPGREIPGLNFPARRLPPKYWQIHPERWPSFCMQIVTWHGRNSLSIFNLGNEQQVDRIAGVVFRQVERMDPGWLSVSYYVDG